MSDQPLPEADRIEGHPHPRETSVLYGQDRAAQAFLDAWTAGRLHHAWLLRGPRGVGKATLAYLIARALIADPGDDGAGLFGDAPARSIDVPADCPVQARILAQAEPRLFVLRRTWDADKKRLQTQISVDDVRAMRRFLSLSAADGGWRVIIADSADEMTRSAANALLKFLEEPPPRSMFLLLSHAPAGLLATIRSRCRTLDLAPLDPDALAAALAAAGAAPPAGAEAALAQLSAGSVGEALRLVARDGLELYARLVQMLGSGRGRSRCAGKAGGALRRARRGRPLWRDAGHAASDLRAPCPGSRHRNTRPRGRAGRARPGRERGGAAAAGAPVGRNAGTDHRDHPPRGDRQP